MRSLSLAVAAATSLLVGIGLAQAAYLGQPFHAGPLAGHRISPTAQYIPTSTDSTALYIVQLKDVPATLYKGDIAGHPATNPRMRGQRMLDTFAPETRAYAAYLGSRQAEMLAKASSVLNRSLTPHFQYRYALNGMSLRLTAAEAFKLAQLDGVLSIEPVRYYKPTVGDPASAADTNASRAWINAPGVWALPSNSNLDTEGEGIVVADVDTGINDLNSSFAATGSLDAYVAQNPLGSGHYLGVCDPGNSAQHALSTPLVCNNKLIGAYSYIHGSHDPDSPEDSEGHGSHTASIMVGDFTQVSINGVNTPLSGVAPHASIIAYDVCDPADLCPSDGTVKAIDQAIQDQATIKSAAASNGVPFNGMVLNYSIGGGDASTDPYSDPVELAFLSAVEAGIYVSAAAGNGGPVNVIANDPLNFPVYPVEHVVPWVASTAAATYDQFLGNALEGFSGGDSATLPVAPMDGASITGGYGPANVVYSGNYIDPVATGTAPTSNTPYPSDQGPAADAQQCLFPFSPGTFSGAPIVVCDRGTNPLVDKAYNVEQGGAGGVVIAATGSSAQDMVAESYFIPATLLDKSDGDALRAWLAASSSGGTSGTAMASISNGMIDTNTSEADQVAGFSSRGPTGTAYDNLVKPELTAPGVGVLAAYANENFAQPPAGFIGSNAETFVFLDGTSMAAPHDTASAGLLMALHPGWTPAQIRSALMLTAVIGANGVNPGLTDQCASLDSGENCIAGTTLPPPQVRGAGRIDVEAASRTGLLLDENGTDYTNANPDTGGDLSALNLPGLANDDCGQSCSWTRTFTSAFMSANPAYSITMKNMTPGLTIGVSRNSISVPVNASVSLTITADTAGVQQGQWAFGEVDITTADTGDGGVTVAPMHLPVAVLSVVPAAHMSIDQTSLDFSAANGATSTAQFSISNNGQVTLNWKISTLSGPSTQSLTEQAVGSSAGKPLSSSTIWNQISSGMTGLLSDFFTRDGHGVYAADTFVVPAKADISEIVAQGFARDSTSVLQITGTVNWYIYADSSGKPVGNPDDGKKDYAWHYSADAASAGVDVSNGVITLNLATAGQPAAQLQSGKYWLMVAPTFSSEILNGDAARWFWFEGRSTDAAKSAMFIDPGDFFGSGINWQAASPATSLAFTLAGSFDCSGAAMRGLSLSSTSGSVKAGGSQTVTATFKSSGLAAATYNGAVCVSGNASDNPQIVLPVTAAVTGGSGKGGGGELGFLSLVGLAWALRRRRLR